MDQKSGQQHRIIGGLQRLVSAAELGQDRSEHIWNELLIEGRMPGYRNKWLEHAGRVEANHIPKRVQIYDSRGSRNNGRSLKQLARCDKPDGTDEWA